MSSRRSDSKNSKRVEMSDKKSSDMTESDIPLNEIRSRAKREQTNKTHSHHDRHRDHDFRHKPYRQRDRNEDSGQSSGRNRRQNYDSRDRNKEFKTEAKSEEFWSKNSKNGSKSDEKVVEKQKPNFKITGKLAEDTNTFNGVVIKYNEPLEARKPKRRWRLYPFKGEESLNFIPIHRQSAYLMGRDRKVADIPIDHPSCSKQHAIIQYRLVEFDREDSTIGKRVRPYIIDLEASNGTFVNNQKIESKRFYELFEKDVIKFGFSTREYVVLHEQSKDEDEDDDIEEREEGEEGEEEIQVKSEPND